MSRLDPVTLEILSNALRSVTDECFIALMKSAFSTNIKERHDHSIAIMDAAGRLVVQAERSIPIHLASMTGTLRTLLKRYPLADIAPGDLFIANDPHVAGGTHLPDINLVMPVFADGRIAAFVCNIAHHADVGGAAAGSMSGALTEIYQEGLRIPMLRLMRQGVLQEEMLDLLLLNMRIPEERKGDLNAQIAACRLGVARLEEIIARTGASTMTEAFDEIITRTGGRMRAAIARIPNGTYRCEDVLDDDGTGVLDITLCVTVTKRGETIRFDFAGSSPQVPGNVNMTINAVQSAVCYAMKALLDPEAPNSQGVIDAIEVTAPEGTITNCVFPAAVALRANTSQRVVDLVIGALAPVLPDEAIGAANGANTSAVFAGVDPRSGRRYVYLETLGGGMGGRSDRDGKDGVQVHITNTSNLPVEAIEMEYPLRVEEYAFVEDSGGAGTWRGGLGLRRVVRPVGHTCEFSGVGERFRHRPWGIFGGEPGAMGRFRKVVAGGQTEPLPHKSKGLALKPEEAVIIETPGAGGYGPPSARTKDALAEDRSSGKLTASFLSAHYGRAKGTPQKP